MRSNRLFAGVVAALMLAACTNQYGPKQTGGAIIGAGLGGLAGSQIGSGTGRLAATGAGVLLGAWLGSEIGASLDRADEAAANQAAQTAWESNPDGQASPWRNPNSGHSGYTTPTHTYQTASGQDCRDYQTAVVIDGRTQTATGTACRQPDGTWRIVN